MILSKILCSAVRKYSHSKRSSQNNFIRSRAIENGGRREQRGHQHFLEQKKFLRKIGEDEKELLRQKCNKE